MYDCGHVLLGLRFCIDKMCMKIAPTGSHKEALIVAHTKSVVMVDPVILAVAVEMVTRISQVLFAKKTQHNSLLFIVNLDNVYCPYNADREREL